MISRQYLIYGLRDPRDKRIRYVGKSSSGMRRPREHDREGLLSREKNQAKRDWIREVHAAGMRCEIVVLQFCHRDELDVAERCWIIIGRSAGTLTNLANGGGGIRQASTETRAKMSAVKLGKRHSEETKKKISDANRGRKASSETRAAMSAARLGKKASQEARENNAAAQRGRKHSEEVRAKIARAHLGLRHTDESRAKISAAKRNPSEATREKLSIAAKNRSPETRENMAAAQRGKTLSSETIAKRSASLRQYHNRKKETTECLTQ